MSPAPLFHQSRPAMGTDFELWLDAADATRAGELFEVVFEEIERVEAALSTYRATSEISRINRLAGRRAVTTDPETMAILERAQAHSAASGGAFDITVGRLVRAWGFFRGAGRYPSDAEIAQARSHTGWRHLELDADNRTVAFRRPGMLLDLGAVGKGYALDRVAAVLRGLGVGAALVGAGSSSWVAIGAPPGQAAWQVNIPDPVDRSRTLSSVGLRNAALSTSGSYGKFFVIDGTRYCHILDPRTGRPVSGMLQATVLAARGEESDALSTAAFVAGPPGAAKTIGDSAERAVMMVAGDSTVRETLNIRWPDEDMAGPPIRDGEQ